MTVIRKSAILLAPLFLACAAAQTRPTFEVASIKPTSLDMATLRAQIQNGATPRIGARVDGARAEYIYVTLQDLFFLSMPVEYSPLCAG